MVCIRLKAIVAMKDAVFGENVMATLVLYISRKWESYSGFDVLKSLYDLPSYEQRLSKKGEIADLLVLISSSHYLERHRRIPELFGVVYTCY